VGEDHPSPPPQGGHCNLQPVLHHAGVVSAQNWSTCEHLCDSDTNALAEELELCSSQLSSSVRDDIPRSQISRPRNVRDEGGRNCAEKLTGEETYAHGWRCKNVLG